jgi:Fic family protein
MPSLRTHIEPTTREYEQTHPWIDFHLDLRRIPARVWVLLGEAASSADHIAHSMLKPDTGRELHQLFLAKGVLATTAIEGNTLSEDDALRAIEGTLKLPASQQYLGQEIQNIIGAANEIKAEMVDSEASPDMSRETIEHYNAAVLHDLPLGEGVVPGRVRNHSVGVARYRGAPHQDCEYLLDRLCDWLNSELNTDDREFRVPYAILKAIVAHLYIAWIHPFGDGNGRTARLLEVQILLAAELPAPVCHLLSNHYNLTRSEYYRHLDMAGRTGNPLPFVEYAVKGLVDGAGEALGTIRAQQFSDRWEQYVYETFGELRTQADRRRLRLVLDMTKEYEEALEPVPKENLRHLSPTLSEAYAGKTVKTLTRDLNAVLSMGLLEPEAGGYVPRDWIILAFRPDRRDADSE